MAKVYCRILLLLLFCGSYYSSVPQNGITEIYTRNIGVREVPKGSNWGPSIKVYLNSVGVKAPAPYCAAFVHFCLSKAGIPNTITAWSPTAHNSKNIVYFKNIWSKDPEPGDVFTLWFPKFRRIAHTGFFDSKVNNSIYKSVEANTNEAGSRDGDGVYRKYRSFKATYSITRWKK